MYTKLVILVALGALLIVSVYSSSGWLIFAEIKTSCMGTSTKTTKCTTFDTETGDNDSWNCKLNADGKTWSCTKAKAMTASSISPELTDALDIAIEGSQKTPKLPRGDILEGGSLLNKDSMKSSNETKVPNDLGGMNDGGLTIGPE